MRDFAALQSDTSKLVLLYLDRVGDASLHEITERLDLSLLTVSATVKHLTEHDLVRRLDTGRVVIADEAALDAPVPKRAAGG
jgi:Mn-dependent DtxR family transcriptional regulator